MAKFRLRTKLLLSMLLVSSALTVASLLFVGRTMQTQVRREILADLNNSVLTFQNVQREREATLSRSAELMADLPTVRAMVTGTDPKTIQDASRGVWRTGGSGGSDLFILTDRVGRVVALHTSTPGFTREMAQAFLVVALSQDVANHWWFGGGHLYEVFLQPIYFGARSEGRLFGSLAVGYEINDQVARDASRVAGSQVAFWYGGALARSTLAATQEAQLLGKLSTGSQHEPDEIQLGNERFLATSVNLAPGSEPVVRLSVLKSYDEATAPLRQLNRLLLGLGIVAVLGGSILAYAISHTFTRPLGALVSGVRALESGDFRYPLEPHGGDEVAEVTQAFSRMRESLQNTQQKLLENERLATIGRMASSISHDLRHSLAAIVANAEFLSESRLDARQREELYHEVRIAVDQMTDLLESLLEFSRTSESLRPALGSIQEPMERALQIVRAHPEFQKINVVMSCEGNCEGWFDFKRLERAFQNLLLNAFEAVSPRDGRVEVNLRQDGEKVIEVVVKDNGCGIPQDVRAHLFEPFVSSGKQNGTGLGLTVVQKIIQDHGGEVRVESTSEQGTVFRVTLPLRLGSSVESVQRQMAARPLSVTHIEP